MMEERGYAVKKLHIVLLCLLFAGLCACGTAPQETPATTSNMEELYSVVIADILENGGNKPPGWSDGDYVLYDTDGKGTMALLLGWDNPNGEIYEIYTLRNGIAELQLSCVDYPGECIIRMYKNGNISASQLNGVGSGGWYRFEDGQLKYIVSIGEYWDENGLYSGYYRRDPAGDESDFFFDFVPDGTEVPITDEECRRLSVELRGDNERAELDWKPLAEYGR